MSINVHTPGLRHKVAHFLLAILYCCNCFELNHNMFCLLVAATYLILLID